MFAASNAAAVVIVSVSDQVIDSRLAPLDGHLGATQQSVPFGVTVAGLVAQWAVILVGLWYVSRRYLSGHPTADYRLRFKPIDLLGIPIGILVQLVVLELLYWPLRSWFPGTFSRHHLEQPARDLTDPAHGGWKVVLVLAVVVCAPLVEELLYRGLLLNALSARIADGLAIVVSALWFAAVHFQPIQFFGLFVFGLVLGVCFQRTGRIGMGIFAHAAFNATSLALLW
jgi:membrane protease YdiL (CAAX protease family)